MPKCEICGKTVKRVWTCKYCGIHFCRKCGDTKNRICKLCLEREESDRDLERDLVQEAQSLAFED